MIFQDVHALVGKKLEAAKALVAEGGIQHPCGAVIKNLAVEGEGSTGYRTTVVDLTTVWVELRKGRVKRVWTE